MPKASEVANELRKLADALDQQPETIVKQARVGFWYDDQKDEFLNTCRLLPRPLVKEYPAKPGAYERINVRHETDAMAVFASIYQSNFCVLVEPAKPAVYDCKPLLSLEEESSLGVEDAVA